MEEINEFSVNELSSISNILIYCGVHNFQKLYDNISKINSSNIPIKKIVISSKDTNIINDYVTIKYYLNEFIPSLLYLELVYNNLSISDRKIFITYFQDILEKHILKYNSISISINKRLIESTKQYTYQTFSDELHQLEFTDRNKVMLDDNAYLNSHYILDLKYPEKLKWDFDFIDIALSNNEVVKASTLKLFLNEVTYYNNFKNIDLTKKISLIKNLSFYLKDSILYNLDFIYDICNALINHMQHHYSLTEESDKCVCNEYFHFFINCYDFLNDHIQIIVDENSIKENEVYCKTVLSQNENSEFFSPRLSNNIKISLI